MPVELQLGRKWSSRFTRSAGGETAIDGYINFHVTKRERIRVVAGEFDAFRIDGEGFGQAGRRQVIVAWLVPGFNFPLRTDRRLYDARSLRVLDAELRELVACRQQIWRQA